MSRVARAPKRPTTSWSAMAAAGESSVKDGVERQSPCDCRCRSGRDGESGCGARDRKDIGESRPLGDLPDRRFEPKTTLPIARDRRMVQPDSMAAPALV